LVNPAVISIFSCIETGFPEMVLRKAAKVEKMVGLVSRLCIVILQEL
jgi:hypothetical protein